MNSPIQFPQKFSVKFARAQASKILVAICKKKFANWRVPN